VRCSHAVTVSDLSPTLPISCLLPVCVLVTPLMLLLLLLRNEHC